MWRQGECIVCVCVCTRTHTSSEKVGILIAVLDINVTIYASVVTISKIRRQCDVIWSGSSLVSSATVALSAAVDRSWKVERPLAYCDMVKISHPHYSITLCQMTLFFS